MNFDSLWIEKYRPKTLDDIVLSEQEKSYFSKLAEKKEIPHLLFNGVPGTGKTSTAKIITNEILQCQTLYLNASDENGIDSIRTKITNFAKTRSIDGKLKCVLLDESDLITESAQRALRGLMEEYSHNTRFILTCNYLHNIIPAIQSRCLIINLQPPLEKIVKRVGEILRKEQVKIPQDQKEALLDLIKRHYPDLRKIIGSVQRFSYLGTLNIERKDSIEEIVKDIWEKILKKRPIQEIRTKLIQSLESKDFSLFLQKLFYHIASDSSLTEETKCMFLITIGDHLRYDTSVQDKEINATTCLLYLLKQIQ